MPSDLDTTAGPRRTHPLTVIGGLVAVGIGTLLNVIAGDGNFDVVLQLLGGLAVVRWWFTTYEIGPDELIVRQGVLSRRQQVVPYRRVQQIDIRRSLFMQVFGLAALRIETAGSQAGTVNLALLGTATAEDIRVLVLARRGGADAPTGGTTPPPGPRQQTVLTLGGAELMVWGATASGVVVLDGVAILFTAVGLVAGVTSGDAYYLAAIGTGVLAVAVTMLSAVMSALSYGNYELAVTADEIRLARGVLDRRLVTIPKTRVQHVEVVDNPLRHRLGFVSVYLRSAALLGGGGRSGASQPIVIPRVPRDHVAALLTAVMGDDSWTPAPLVPRPPAARRRGIARRTALLAFPGVVALGIDAPALVLVALLAVALLGIPWGIAAHRRAGLGVNDTVTAFAAGTFHHQTHLVPHARVQSARTIQSVFQRRSNLATIALDIAGSRAPSLYDSDASTARSLRLRTPLESIAVDEADQRDSSPP